MKHNFFGLYLTFQTLFTNFGFFIQTLWINFAENFTFDQENDEDSEVSPGFLGKGKCKTAKRKSWRKKCYLEMDLLHILWNQLEKKKFMKHFAGYSATQVDHFFNKIQEHLIRHKETKQHARNKLLLWIDKCHNKQRLHDLVKFYQIGISTAKRFFQDVQHAILKSNIISFPSEEQRNNVKHQCQMYCIRQMESMRDALACNIRGG